MEETAALLTGQQPLPTEVVEKIVIGGDLAALNAAQRANYYTAVCRSLGLNQLTKPFEYLHLNGKLRLYALRDCADQLRRLHGISIYIANRERVNDIYVVTARAKDRQGREDESTGAVAVGNLKGDALANALMKAETKAKRRVTLSIAGLGWLDETELETIPQRRPVGGSDQEHNDSMHPAADQITSLVELAKACGVDLVDFGQHMRQLMNLSEDTRVTKKFLRESMTMTQFEEAWQHYSDRLKKHVEEELLKEPIEEDVLDYPPPGQGPSLAESSTEEGQPVDLSTAASVSDTPSDPIPTAQQPTAARKRRGQQAGEDSGVDTSDGLER
jgi:hypothetical protein